jgi:serine/threonine protein kinase
MVVEYCEGGALVGPGALTPEHRMPEAIAQYYFRQMVAGVAYLHENKVVS